jgi:hypothetical protein
MNVLGSGALEQRESAVQVRPWSMWPPLYGEGMFALVRKLTVAVPASIYRRLSRSPVAEIRVSPMSVAWLELHQRDYDKHQAQF